MGIFGSYKNKFLRTFAGVVIGCGFGSPAAADVIDQTPAPLLEEVLDEASTRPWDPDDRQRLLVVLAQDPRAVIRRGVAESVAADASGLAWETTGDLLRGLARDREPMVRAAAARALAALVSPADPSVRGRILSDWASSESWQVRQAAAQSLSWASPVSLDRDLIDELSRDLNPVVRGAAVGAARSRFADDPTCFRAILERARDDSDATVRRAARRALRFGLLPGPVR